VLRWDDFTAFESLIDEYLAEPPYELSASDLAVRAQAVDEQPEGAGFDYASLADALGG
jgi:hypothetical protein